MLNKEHFLKLIEMYPESLDMQDGITFFFCKNGVRFSTGRYIKIETYMVEQFFISYGDIRYDITKEEFTKITDVFNKKQCEKVKELLEPPKKEVKKEKMLDKNKILVVDIYHILPEYKDKTTDEVKTLLEYEFGHKVFLIDSSRHNIQSISNCKPIYFIE